MLITMAREKWPPQCISQIVLHLSTQAAAPVRTHTHSHTQTHMHTESSQHAEITLAKHIIYNVCLMWFTSHLQSNRIIENSFPPFCIFSVKAEDNIQDCHDVADCIACTLLSTLLLSI